MKVIFSLVLFAATLIIPAAFVFAEVKYIPMVGLPRLDPNAQTTEQYVQALFFLSIAAAAILAFVKILFGGVKWMLSDVVTDKASAKKDIQGAIFGLLIVLSAYLVLNTINPRLLELNILQSAPTLGIVGGSQTRGEGTQIGDFYGWWCGDIFTLVCSPEYEQGKQNFFNSCINDAQGSIQTVWGDGYTCIPK